MSIHPAVRLARLTPAEMAGLKGGRVVEVPVDLSRRKAEALVRAGILAITNPFHRRWDWAVGLTAAGREMLS